MGSHGAIAAATPAIISTIGPALMPTYWPNSFKSLMVIMSDRIAATPLIPEIASL